MNEITMIYMLRALLAMSLTGSVIATLLFAAKRLLKRWISKTNQYYLWFIVIVVLIVPLSANLPIQRTLTISSVSTDESGNTESTFSPSSRPVYSVRDILDRYVFHAAEESYHTSIPVHGFEERDAQDRLTVKPRSVDFAKRPNDPAIQPINSAKSPIDLVRFAIIIWLTGILVLLGFTLYSYRAYIKRLNRTLRQTDITVNTFWRTIPVFRSTAIRAPMLIGVFGKKIILPDKEYNDIQLQYILLHEKTHLRRLDLPIKWLTVFVNAIHWFNPMIYFVRRELNHACELACDEALIQKLDPDGRQDYGDTLLTVVSDSRHPSGFFSTTMSGDGKKIEERLRSIMEYRKSTKQTLYTATILAVSLMMFAMGLNASSADGAEWHIIQLDSLKLSAMPTDAVLNAIAELTNTKNGEILMSVTDSGYLTVDSAYQMTRHGPLEIFTPMDDAANDGETKYLSCRLLVESSDRTMKILRRHKEAVPKENRPMRCLLNALKHIPVDEVNCLFDSPPDEIMIDYNWYKGGLYETPSYGKGTIYYNQHGVTGNGDFLLNLKIVPMYKGENGQLSGLGINVVHLYYSE